LLLLLAIISSNNNNNNQVPNQASADEQWLSEVAQKVQRLLYSASCHQVIEEAQQYIQQQHQPQDAGQQLLSSVVHLVDKYYGTWQNSRKARELKVQDKHIAIGCQCGFVHGLIDGLQLGAWLSCGCEHFLTW
jgi:hypothetical protein